MSPVRRAAVAARALHARYLLRPQLRLTTWWRYGRRHAAPIDPFHTLWVDPATIDTFLDMEREDLFRIRHAFSVVDGDWDLGTAPLAEHFVFDSIHAHFVRGQPWAGTPLHRYAMEAIERGRGWYHGCRTTADLDRRLTEIAHLYDTVRDQGYRTQRQLDGDTARQPLQRRRARPGELDEILVHIDRHGRFVFVDGIHRLSVAKVAGVPAVPVCVLFRHGDWQAHRDRVARDPTAYPASTFEHPDLAALRRAPRGRTAEPAPRR